MIEKKRILIVDDEPYNILGLQILISQSSYPGISNIIDFAHNGQEAYHLVKKASKADPYGLIFMDLSMPVMDGYEAAMKIRNYLSERNLDQPMICAVTGHCEEDYI